MQIRQLISKVRVMPDSLSLKRECVFSLCILLLGFGMGIGAKASDSVSVIGDIGTYLGVWVFTATLIAAFSKSPLLAALNTLLFFLSMLAAYYIYGQVVLGFFPRSYFFMWLFIALLSPFAGIVAWFSRGKGVFAIISASLPIAILLKEGYPAYYTYGIPSIFALLCAIVLLIILPETWIQKGLVLILAIVLTVILVWLRILPF